MAASSTSDGDRFADWARGRMDALVRFGAALAGADGAEDLVQTALARTWAAWTRVERRDDPEGYVRRVMVNEQIGQWRRRRARRAGTVISAALVADASSSIVDPSEPVWRALHALPPRQRAVLVLRYCEDRSELETAALLGCSVGTVKSQAAKGLAKLRVVLADWGEEAS